MATPSFLKMRPFLLFALLHHAVAITDPILAAGIAELHPGSDSSEYAEPGKLHVVGAIQYADSNVAGESMRLASGLFNWRDHINSQGGLCIGGSSYDPNCSPRYPVRRSASMPSFTLTARV
jgi:hypothetical protein